jgi:hypothetical protein
MGGAAVPIAAGATGLGLGGIIGGGGAAAPPAFDVEAAGRSARETARFNTLLAQFGFQSPFGGIQFTGEPGTAERQQITTTSPFTQALLEQAQGIAPQIGAGVGSEAARRAEEAVLGTFASRFEPRFERQQQTLQDRLLQQGIPIGSEASGRALGDLAEQQEAARLQAQRESVLTGQNVQSQQLSNALAAFGSLLAPVQGIGAGRIQTPTGVSTDPFLAQQQANLQRFQVQAQQRGDIFGALGTLGAGGLAGLGSFLG